MDLLRKAQQMETRISKAFDRAAHRVAGSEPLQPLEIIHAILDSVQSHIEPAGRGRRSFPFNRLRVTLAAVTRHDRARLDALLKGKPPLADRIVDRLRASGCDVDAVAVTIAYAATRTEGWTHPQFHLEFDRVAHGARPDTSAGLNGPGLELAITRGVAERRHYTSQASRIDLGRQAEVRNSRHRLIRTNHVAFLDGAEQAATNHSVSRCHAHIVYDRATSSYRVHDDGSAHGTVVVRGGRSIEVSSGSRGVRLCSGDELVLGDARLRIKILTVE
jgi:FHA domain-containing protein